MEAAILALDRNGGWNCRQEQAVMACLLCYKGCNNVSNFILKKKKKKKSNWGTLLRYRCSESSLMQPELRKTPKGLTRAGLKQSKWQLQEGSRNNWVGRVKANIWCENKKRKQSSFFYPTAGFDLTPNNQNIQEFLEIQIIAVLMAPINKRKN